jgi:N-acyl-D-amino-acid deacylase
MAEFDTVIQGGMVIDGTRMPRYRADVGIKEGKIAKIGKLQSHQAKKVIDAGGMNVVPGFVDLHTHYDAQLFWDPYCTISSWHGVTSIVIGNCGFGFAPVRPELRDRAMLTMTRTEAIPYASMKAGLPWDWVTYPEFLDSVERHPKGVNMLPFVPMAPVMTWAMGLEDAKSGRMPTEAETQEMCRIVNEAMDRGACGWSAQRLGRNSIQADFDGTPMVTDLMHDETALALASVLAERNEGFIQMAYVPDAAEHDNDILKILSHSEKHWEDLARVSGRPILYNAILVNDTYPERFRYQLHWLESCLKRGLRVYGQSLTLEQNFAFTFKDWNLWDDMPEWRECTTGPIEDRLMKLSDPERRPLLRMVTQSGIVTNNIADIIVLQCQRPELKKYENLTVGEIAKSENKHAVDAMLDIACADGLNAEFYTPPINVRLDHMAEMITHDALPIFGVSDGGAHTKFFTGGRYATEALVKFVRNNPLLSLEEAHWRLSAHPAMCGGFRDRGTLVEGAAADLVVYDLAKLKILPMEVVHDFPGGEWRRVQRAEGYQTIMVNGEVTFEDGRGTGAVPGRLLRHGVRSKRPPAQARGRLAKRRARNATAVLRAKNVLMINGSPNPRLPLRKPMDAHSALSLAGRSLEQVAFVVNDLAAAQDFFGKKMGVPRFYVIEDFGHKAADTTFRGHPARHNFSLAIAYSGNTQIELIQHLSGETTYKEFLERKGEGLHHLGFFLHDRDAYEKTLSSLREDGLSILQSGRMGDAHYTYIDSEATIGAIMEIVHLGPQATELMARVKRGDF